MFDNLAQHVAELFQARNRHHNRVLATANFFHYPEEPTVWR